MLASYLWAPFLDNFCCFQDCLQAGRWERVLQAAAVVWGDAVVIRCRILMGM